ncbi:hypothetical protein DPMN_166247 [Dreissena polymorpha]|uniref:Uncharacterized protein n=1 Tax=Dreissena polymorpha TaxID=45954 RepID=A0A9D4EYH9_DREPO|nr:hypothetical protein DPMN_166247 [Dreissena polymorpha]
MISKADDTGNGVQRIPLSFSISRILSKADDNESCARKEARAEHATEEVARIHHLHGATIHHFAPPTETEAYSHFGRI